MTWAPFNEFSCDLDDPRLLLHQFACSGHAEHTPDTPSRSRSTSATSSANDILHFCSPCLRKSRALRTCYAIDWGSRECAQRVRGTPIDWQHTLNDENRARTHQVMPMSVAELVAALVAEPVVMAWVVVGRRLPTMKTDQVKCCRSRRHLHLLARH